MRLDLVRPFAGVIGLIVVAVAGVGAQPSPLKVDVLRSEGTPDEASLIQSLTNRVKTKFSSDAAFSKRVDDLLKQRDFATVKTVLAQGAQLSADRVWIGEPKTQSFHDGGAVAFRFAAYERPAYNPYFVMFIIGNYAVCMGGTKEQCYGAIRGAGRTPAS
jgi:hypothetical protein